MLVSVIIPTYNRAGTIERAVNSVLAQSWTPLEIIIVDGWSTDRTWEILTRYGDKIRLARQERQGIGAARNAGIQMARGEIISFLDSDDEWLPVKTERQVKLLEATKPAGVPCCVCSARMEFAKGTVNSFTAAGWQPERREGICTNAAALLTTRFLFFNQVVAIRREALEQTGYFRPGIMEDYDLALRLSLLGPWTFIADPLVVWHEQPGDNDSQKTSELDRCVRAREILQDVSRSPQLGPRLPPTLLRRRLQSLTRKIGAGRLSASSNPAVGLLGRCWLQWLWGWDIFDRRLPSYPRMMTRPL